MDVKNTSCKYINKNKDSGKSITQVENDIRISELKINRKTYDDKEINKRKTIIQSQYREVINFDIVNKIEMELDYTELVSMVFLVYDDLDLECALDRLTIAHLNKFKNTCLLAEWCRSEPQMWREKLLQALLVIKNFYVLTKLGYKRDDANYLFLNKNYLMSIRIAVYNFCESLSIAESKLFITKINNTLKNDPNNHNEIEQIIPNDPTILELSFLFWLSRKYLSIYSNGVNLSYLFGCLEDSEHLQNVKNKLIEIDKNFNSSKNKSDKTYSCGIIKQNHPDIKNGVDSANTPSSKELISNSLNLKRPTGKSQLEKVTIIKRYPIINPKEVGICIIINQTKFVESSFDLPFLEERIGTEFDVLKIKTTFERLSYTVFLRDDLHSYELLKWIKCIIDENFNRKVHSSVFLFVLTHGYEGHIYAVDGIGIPIDSIGETMWQCEQLIGIPKCLIVQACQGEAYLEAAIVTDGPSSKSDFFKYKRTGPSDMFIGLSTVKGYTSFRHERKGSWFIQILCNCIDEFAETTDFAKIFTMVNYKFSNMKVKFEEDNNIKVVSQIAEARTTLSGDLFLIPQKSFSVQL